MKPTEVITQHMAHVRQLLRRLAAPHPGLRLVTAEAEAHAAMLEPQLAVLDPAPFSGLDVVTDGGRSAAHTTGRRSPPRAMSSSRTPAEPRHAAHPPAPASRPLRGGERLPAPAARKPSHLSAATPELRDGRRAPAVSRSASANARRRALLPSASHEDVQHDTQERSAAASLPAHAQPDANAPLTGTHARIDLGTLVQRVLRRRRSARVSSRPARASTEPVAPIRLPETASAPAAAPARVLPISSRSRHTPQPLAQPLARPLGQPPRSRRTPHADAELEAATSPVTPPGVRPHPPAVHAAATPFVLDPFEAREPDDTDEHALADRIDAALREQARRQGVDLT